MKRIQILVILALLAEQPPALGASPGNAPQLPITGTRIVNVSTEPQLQSAMGNLQHGDTLLLANGTYNLTGSGSVNVGGTSTTIGRLVVGDGGTSTGIVTVNVRRPVASPSSSSAALNATAGIWIRDRRPSYVR